jgi:hypothetical protein
LWLWHILDLLLRGLILLLLLLLLLRLLLRCCHLLPDLLRGFGRACVRLAVELVSDREVS